MKYIFLLALFMAAMPALAADTSAGFATQSVFLSQSSVTEGNSVFIYANMVNPSSSPFEGKVHFIDEAKDIGSVSVSLSAGEARVVSVSWKPSAGSHEITADLEDSSGTSLAKESATFSIKSKPAPTATTQVAAAAAVDSSAQIEQKIADISPQAASAAAPVFTAIDSARSTAAEIIDEQLAQTKPKLPGQVLGAETEKSGSSGSTANTPKDPVGWAFAILWTLYFYLLSVLRFIIGSAAFFYPLILILFLYAMYRLYRRMTGPSYSY